ncbi:MAG: SusC/RagA family TonB-linked outer membrane protein [Bacteroidota bacterium]
MRKLLLILAIGMLSFSSLWAQKAVSGTVTNQDGSPMEGVTVLVQGTTIGVYTDTEGKFSINVPEGNDRLVVSYVGFASQDVSIGNGTVNVSMREDLTLEEVVVTGLGIRKEKKALGYGVSTISAEAVEGRNEADIARILRGKAPGVDITQTSGLSGTGTNVIIRGYSSISGSNQPLFVVDGVPFNTSTNTDRGFQTGGATASSRFLDLDPNNISEISILKGLSATVLYGEAGRNGVVLITTKTGSAGASQKGFEVQFNQSLSFTEVANLPDYQDSYGNGFSGNFGWFFSNWGPSFDVRGSNGIADDGTVEHPYDQEQFWDDFPELRGERYDYKPYESVENFFQRGVLSNTSVSVEKAVGTVGAVSANYSYLADNGFIPDNKNIFTKHNLGLGGNFKLENGLRIQSTFNFVDSDRLSPPASVGFGSNPSGASLFANLIYTPRSIDLLNLPFQSPRDGSMVYYRRGSAIQNPLWTLNNTSDQENITRFFGTMTLQYDLTDWLSATYRLGIDQYSQQQRRSINKGGSQVPDGQLITSNRLNRITDQVLNFQYDFQLTDDLVLDGLVGVNARREKQDRVFTISEQQFVFDLFTHNNFINHNNASFFIEENNVGVYATASLGFRNYLFVNFQGRNDWTSTLEAGNRSVFYPSASVAFIPTDAIAALQNSTTINYLKVRLGYGTSAGYPDPYQTRNVLGAFTNQYITRGGSVLNTNTVADRLGNPNLTPELHTELEFGLEARFFQNRVGIDLSLYDKQSRDLIIDLQLDPATGFTNTTLNAAAVENRGIELGLNLVPIKGAFTWDMNINFTRNVNIVKSVADGVDQVLIPGGGFTNLGNFAIPGEWYGTIQGLPFEKNEAGELLVQANGEYVPGTDIAPIGNPNPNFQTNLINTFSWKGLSLNMQWSYIDGGDIYSVTTATMLARGNTVDTDFNRFLPVVLPGVKSSDESTPNDVQGYAGDFFFTAYLFADEGAIFDGTVIRLRELSLAYDLPKTWMEKLPFGSASLSVNGENLWYNAPNFPTGVNFDPEVLSLGVGNGRGFDYITGPTARRYGASINLTF